MNRFKTGAGFTLLEMVVSIGLFNIVLLAAVAIVISANVSQSKVAEFRRVQDNVRFGLEYLSKEIRTGTNFVPTSCAGGWCPRLTLLNDRGQTIMYCIINSALVRSVVGNCDVNPSDEIQNIRLTSNDIVLTSLSFRVVGNTIGSADGQPMTTIVLRGASAAEQKVKVQTDFNIQTTVTQRLRDY